jgi:exosome complex protein LRP1
VFLELTRVKQYFDKIKTTENPAPLPVRNMALDKSAAGRFIKAGLVSRYCSAKILHVSSHSFH